MKVISKMTCKRCKNSYYIEVDGIELYDPFSTEVSSNCPLCNYDNSFKSMFFLNN